MCGIAVGVGGGVALWGWLVGEFGITGLIVGLVIAYAVTFGVSAYLKKRRAAQRAKIRDDIATLRNRLDEGPGTPHNQ